MLTESGDSQSESLVEQFDMFETNSNQPYSSAMIELVGREREKADIEAEHELSSIEPNDQKHIDLFAEEHAHRSSFACVFCGLPSLYQI